MVECGPNSELGVSALFAFIPRSLTALLLLWSQSALSADGLFAPQSPSDLGVRVQKPVGDGKTFAQGSGVFLGDGLVLTAAHVISADPSNHKATVVLDRMPIVGTVVENGQTQNLDLALIKIDTQGLSAKRRTQAPIPVCPGNPGPNQAVTVASMGIVTQATTISTPITSDGQSGTWTNLLSTGYHPGNSGGGVFNPQTSCLWGIINLELSGTVDGKVLDLTAFVPASKVAGFLKTYTARLAQGPNSAPKLLLPERPVPRP